MTVDHTCPDCGDTCDCLGNEDDECIHCDTPWDDEYQHFN